MEVGGIKNSPWLKMKFNAFQCWETTLEKKVKIGQTYHILQHFWVSVKYPLFSSSFFVTPCKYKTGWVASCASNCTQTFARRASISSTSCVTTRAMERGQSHADVPSYMAWSIFTTVCCCWPLGIAAIVSSSKVTFSTLRFLFNSTDFCSKGKRKKKNKCTLLHCVTFA